MKSICIEHCVRLFLLINLLNVNYILGQPPSLQFEYLTPNQGLSQASVNQIIQDAQGFMWFGTRNGLNRYDGYQFIKFYSNPADTTSVPGDVILSLFVDTNKELWIGTDDGFCIYNPDKDNFYNFNHKESFPKRLLNENISCIYQDSQKQYWLGTYGNGLVHFDKITETYTFYQHDKDKPKSISVNNIHDIIENEDGNLWIATDGGGLNLFNRETETFTHFIPEKNNPYSLSSLSVFSIVKDRSNTYWVGTLGKGICRINPLPNGQYNFSQFRPETYDVRRMKILTMFADENRGLWLGTENGGLEFFDTGTETFYNYQYNENELFGLNSNSIQSIYLDTIGNLWIGTYTGGINVNKSNKKPFTTICKIPGRKNSLNNNAVTCFYKENDSILWIGTDGGGLNCYNMKTGQFRYYTTKNSALLSDAILAICADSYNNIWVTGWSCGLNKYDRTHDRFINISIKKYKLPNNNIFDMQPDKKGNIWIAFAGGGLVMFNTKSYQSVIYNTNNSDLPHEWIFDVGIDHEGNILLGHASGFSILNPDTKKFVSFRHSDSDTNTLSQNLINVITVAHDSTIWIGTPKGLNHFNPNTEKFTRYYVKDGLPNNSIQGITEDQNYSIWISTNNGISKFDPSVSTFKNYSFADGLQGKGFIRNSSLIFENGQILFGGTDGFNMFYPDSIIENTVVPKIVITNFYIFNKPVKIGAVGSPLKKHINQCEEINLSYKQSVISFEFAALEYTAPQQNQYAYKLIPFDKDWNEVGTTRTTTYTNLDPGEYTLFIKASNNDGIWTSEENFKKLRINIEPPFWKTLWFRILMVVVLVSSIWLIIRIRIIHLRHLNIVLENKVKERTKELKKHTIQLEDLTAQLEEKQEEINNQKEELLVQRDALEERNVLLEEKQNHIISQNKELDEHRNKLEDIVVKRTQELADALQKAEESDLLKSSFLANMSHEIRTPMNAIVGFASLLDDEEISTKERDEYVRIINKNSQSLLVLINDIIDISTIQANKMELHFKDIDLVILLNHVINNFSVIAEKHNIELKLQTDNIPEIFSFKGDEVRLIQVFNNLITNAIKFTPNGSIKIGILPINNEITFYVKDTGIGIPEEAQNSIFERFKKVAENEVALYRGTGLGLAISKSLVELWGGKVWFNSVINKGTTFFFTHPVNIEEYKPLDSDINVKKAEMPLLDGKTILIVEDEEDNFNLLKAYLAKTNAKILEAKTGAEAVKTAKNNNPDLILMDIKLPEFNGKDATRLIRKFNPDLPIIAQTAYTYKNEIREMFDAGINDYLAKPIKKHELTAILKKYLTHVNIS